MYDILRLRAHPNFLHGIPPEEIHARLGAASYLPANLAPPSGFTYSPLTTDFVLGAEAGEGGELEILEGMEVLEDEDGERQLCKKDPLPPVAQWVRLRPTLFRRRDRRFLLV